MAQEKTLDSSNTDQMKIRERLNDVNRKLLTLEWDKRNNQLNPGMEAKYTKLRTERAELEKLVQS